MAGELVPLSEDDDISSPTELQLSSADDVDSDRLFDRLRMGFDSFMDVL